MLIMLVYKELDKLFLCNIMPAEYNTVLPRIKYVDNSP